MVKKVQNYKQIYFSPTQKWGYRIKRFNEFTKINFNFDIQHLNYQNNFKYV